MNMHQPNVYMPCTGYELNAVPFHAEYVHGKDTPTAYSAVGK